MQEYSNTDMELEGPPPEDEERPISEHFIELSIRLRRIFAAIIIAAGVLSFIPVDFKYYIPLVSYFPRNIITHVVPQEVTWRGHTYHVYIAQYNPFAGFSLLIKSALVLGIIGASPVIVRETYAFLRPALYPHERRMFKWFLVVGLGLFTVGVVLALLFVLPFAVKIMIITSSAVVGPNKLIAFSDIEKLFDTIILLSIATGLAFEAPLIVYILIYLGVVDDKWFHGDNLKYLFLASMILGAIVSPDPSGVGMIVIGTSMFLAIVAAARLASKRKSPYAGRRLAKRRSPSEVPAIAEAGVPA